MDNYNLNTVQKIFTLNTLYYSYFLILLHLMQQSSQDLCINFMPYLYRFLHVYLLKVKVMSMIGLHFHRTALTVK